MITWLRAVFKPRSNRDPYAAPFGDLPPLPAGSLLDQDNHLARRAAPAGPRSGGDGNHLSGAAAAGTSSPSSWRGRRAH